MRSTRSRGEAPLSAVANQEKLLPPEFISADGFAITDAARRYLAPLIVGEALPAVQERSPGVCAAAERGDAKKTNEAVRPMKSGQVPLADLGELASDQRLALSWEEQPDAPS